MNIYILGHKSPDLDSIVSSVAYADFLKKSKRYEGAQVISVLPGEINKETKYVFHRFGIELPKPMDNYNIVSSDAFILVDHNEETQRHERVVADQVIEIVDHHKINVNFTSPVRIDVKPLGSTSSLIYEHYEMYGFKPSQEIAGLLLSAIISDTVGLKSSTTTGIDTEIASKLAGLYKIDLEKLTYEIFKAKSDLSGMTAAQLVNKDLKVFDFSGKRVLIAQIETVEPDKVLENKADIISGLQQAKADNNVGIAYLFVTDILKLTSRGVCCTEEEKKLLEKAFTAVGDDGVVNIGPKISRKKDIAPAIEKALI